MRFINPKTDFAFKKIFGSEERTDILISFLNALLYAGQPTIEDLTIINPAITPRIRGIKDTYLDVKAKLDDGTTVIIEMQVLNVEAFEKRILYNAAKAYSLQLESGDKYELLNPVIALTITDFEMFNNFTHVISHFVLKEKEYLFDYLTHDIELVFVELPKFNKELDDLETLTDKWIYFLKNAKDLNTVPEKMASVPAIQKAFDVANTANLTAEELDDQERREIYIQDQRGAITKALKQGIQQGIKEGQLALIMRQLQRRVGQVSPEIESRIGSLSVEQLENLGDALMNFNNVSDLTDFLTGM